MKIRIRGYYGNKNLGDDYILYSLLNTISKLNQNVDVEIETSGSDKYSELFELFPSLKCTVINSSASKKDKIRSLLRLFNQDFHIFGGGGLFPKDNYKSYVGLYLRTVLTKIGGGRNLIYGIDLCDIERKKSKKLWKKIIKNCELVTLRNNHSEDLLRLLDRHNKVIKGSDITFALTTSVEENGSIDAYLERNKINVRDKEYIIVVPARPWSDEELKKEECKERYSKLVQSFSKLCNRYYKLGYQIVFFPFYGGSDIKFIRDVVDNTEANCLVIEENDLPIEAKRAFFSKAKACISMRFHGVAFSLFSGTPVSAISYAPKTSELLRESSLEDYFVEYGISSKSGFFREFDFDNTVLQKKCDSVILYPNIEKIRNASKLLKKQAMTVESEFIDVLKKEKI